MSAAGGCTDSNGVSASGSADAADDLRERRRYWTAQLDEAWEFMERTLRAPLLESSETAEDLTSVLPASLEVTFAFDRIASGDSQLFYLRSSLVPRLMSVVSELRDLALSLRIEYAYRSPETQARLCASPEVLGRVIERVRWEEGRIDVSPEFVYKRLIVLCANVYKNATHVAGSAVDVTVTDLNTGLILDFGAPFLALSEVTPMTSPFVSAPARRNRALVRGIFAEHGFRAYPYEFWHFSAGDVYEWLLSRSDEEVRFGPVSLDLVSGRVTSIPNAIRDIIPREDLLKRIAVALGES